MHFFFLLIKNAKIWAAPCLFEISAYFSLRTLPISGGVCLFRENGR
jgi:hypothetical protein